MKQIITLALIFSINHIFAQSDQLEKILNKANPDKTETSIQKGFDYLYGVGDTDNMELGTESLNFYLRSTKCVNDSTLPNAHLHIIYFNLIASDTSSTGLFWANALKDEYLKVYGHDHPYIQYLEGQLLNKFGLKEQAYLLFLDLHLRYPKSVMPICYLYLNENSRNKAEIILRNLKEQHPNHYYVNRL